jgi:hypothetical protein
MKTNVEILEEKYRLDAVSQRMFGYTDKGEPKELTEEMKAQINAMLPVEICQKYVGWHLGDEGWATNIIDLYDALHERSK